MTDRPFIDKDIRLNYAHKMLLLLEVIWTLNGAEGVRVGIVRPWLLCA